MLINQGIKQAQTTVVEKMTQARTVAYIRFRGMNEVGRRIWMVRDWIRDHGMEVGGSPSCIFCPDGDDLGELSGDCLCEVQWDLPAYAGRIAGNGNGYEKESSCARGSQPMDGVKIKHVRSERVLSAIHWGDTETIGTTLRLLLQALQDGGYKPVGPHREIYLFDVCLPKSMWMTEIQIQVAA